MAEIRQTPVRVQTAGPMRRMVRWLARPRAVTVRLRPAWTLALAVGLAAILLMPGHTPGAAEGVAKFVGHFPGARSVEVVGSFNDWSRGTLHLSDDDHDGVWRGGAGLPAGQQDRERGVEGKRGDLGGRRII